MASSVPQDVVIDDILKPLLLKDLRIQCRARGINPGGGRETLMERLKENMLETGNIELFAENATDDAKQNAMEAPASDSGSEVGTLRNNYHRPEGQNVGNFITDRPSSRVLAPPGGGSSISIG